MLCMYLGQCVATVCALCASTSTAGDGVFDAWQEIDLGRMVSFVGSPPDKRTSD